MTGQQLKNSILQEAIQGRLVPNVLEPGEKTGVELLQQILKERQDKENKEKGKKARKLTLSTIEEEPWELPAGWCWCKLKDIIDFTSSGTTKNSAISSDSWILDLEDIEKETGRLLRKKRFGEIKSLSDKRAFKVGNVLYSKLRPYLNKCIIAKEDGYCTTEILAFDFGPIYNRYAQSFLMSPYFVDRVNQGSAGVKMPRVNNSEANDTCFPIPPLSIQHRIVEKIEELFPLVDEYDKAAGELEELNKILPDKLRKSMLQEAIHGNLVPNDIPEGEATASELLQQILKERQDKENKEKGKKAKKLALSTIEEEPWELPAGWCWCKLSDLFNIVSARRVHQSDWRTSGIPFYRTREIGWLSEKRTDVKPELYIEESLYEKFEQSGYPSAGDIMITAVGTIGKTYIVRPGDKFYYKDASVLCLENFSKVNPKYICNVIASDFFKSMVAEEAMGTTVATITIVRAKDYLVPLPPLSIQKDIVKKIEEVFATIDKLQS